MSTNLARFSVRTRFVFLFGAFVFLTSIFVYQLYFATNVRATSSTILISEFRTRGTAGANDEFVELYNATSSAIDIGGWKINRSNGSGTINTQLTITAGTMIPAHGHFLATNSAAGGYSGSVPGNQTYGTGITDDGGIAVLNPASVVIDQVGMSAGSAYKEGTVLSQLTTNLNRSHERKPGGANGSSTPFLYTPPSRSRARESKGATPAGRTSRPSTPRRMDSRSRWWTTSPRSRSICGRATRDTSGCARISSGRNPYRFATLSPPAMPAGAPRRSHARAMIDGRWKADASS